MHDLILIKTATTFTSEATATITTQRGDELPRTYTVCLADDPPERREAIEFFRARGDVSHRIELPPVVENMPVEDANRYLAEHPIPRLSRAVHVCCRCSDDDLARLRYVPEVERLRLADVSNAGLIHVAHLRRLLWLGLHSRLLTDACLATVRGLTSLLFLEMTGVPNVSKEAFAEAVTHLPNLRDSWGPQPSWFRSYAFQGYRPAAFVAEESALCRAT